MPTLVTGATGFIGSHIARKLVQKGEKVRVLLRKTSKTVNIDDIDVERVYGDVLDVASVTRAVQGCDTLYHVAGLVSFKQADYKKMDDINIKGTNNVLSAALEAGVKRAVYTSSVAAIGVDPKGGIADEKTPFTMDDLSIKYIASKYHAEKEALRFHEKGLPLVIVNPSLVIGAGDVYVSTTGLILWYCKKKLPGYLDGGVNLVDVEDVAEGHILAAEKGRLGERYILGNRNLSINELFTLLEKVTGIPRPRIKIPYFLALAGGFIAERVLKMPAPNYVAMDIDSIKGTKFYWYYDSSKAVRELGYSPTPIEESIKKTVGWFKNHGYLDN
ncbi:MAG TPA: SDR family oxidoreductase [Thermodesulfobacteriota bacterium]|jgi:dihydroflavonol-4-reductase